MSWPMFHWRLSRLKAVGTRSGGARLPTVDHHDGEDIPFEMPVPARPNSNVAGVSSCAQDITTRKAIDPASSILAISRIVRRSRESAAAPKNMTETMPASGAVVVASVTSTGSFVRRSMMKPQTSVIIQTPVFATRPVASSQRKARLRNGANSSLTSPRNRTRSV